MGSRSLDSAVEWGKPDGQLRSLPPAAPGSPQFGKFRLIARLGQGGMGEVFLAGVAGTQGFSKLVVVKRLREEHAADPVMRELFTREARVAARLNHANVVQTYEVGEQDGTIYMAMEYLEGHSLAQLARAWPRPADARFVAWIISEALAGLHYAHELPDYDGTPLEIVHRDVSPHNIFITYDGQVKIVDFGIAKAARSEETEAGVLKGKTAYMAPEQLTQGKVDPRADVFTTGIVLWELLTGQRLFADESMEKSFFRLLNVPTQPPSSFVAGIPPNLDAIVLRALEKDPAKRYSSAREMRDALEQYLATAGPPVRQEDVGLLVSILFQNKRKLVRDRIATFMAAADDSTWTGSLQSLSDSHLAIDSRSGRSPNLIGSPATSQASGLRQRSKSVTVSVVAIAVAVGSLLLLFARLFVGSAAPATRQEHGAPGEASAVAPAIKPSAPTAPDSAVGTAPTDGLPSSSSHAAPGRRPLPQAPQSPVKPLAQPAAMPAVASQAPAIPAQAATATPQNPEPSSTSTAIGRRKFREDL